MCEINIPIVIKNVLLPNSVKTDQAYHNVIIENLENIKYKRETPYTYKRTISIKRNNEEHVNWPEHPVDSNGKMLGAIALIVSRDNMVLFVKNRGLWGFPKGARSYKDYLRVKGLTDSHFRQTGEIYQHEHAEFIEAESSLENICREVLEETGIKIEHTGDLELLDKRSHGYCSYDCYLYMYPKTIAEFDEELRNNGTDHENDELGWFSLENIYDMLYEHESIRVFNHITYCYLTRYMYRLREKLSL